MDVDGRRLVDAQHAVVVEIALLHAALVDRDLAIERRSQPEEETALQLRDDGVGIDGDAGVDRAGDAMHADLAVAIDLDVGDGGDEARERNLYRDAAAAARRQGIAPAGLLRRKLQRRLEARHLVAELGEAEFDGILAGLFGQLVDEAFDGEDVVVRPTPRQKPVGTAGGSHWTNSTRILGMS